VIFFAPVAASADNHEPLYFPASQGQLAPPSPAGLFHGVDQVGRLKTT